MSKQYCSLLHNAYTRLALGQPNSQSTCCGPSQHVTRKKLLNLAYLSTKKNIQIVQRLFAFYGQPNLYVHPCFLPKGAQIGLKGKSFGPQEKKNFQIQAIDHLQYKNNTYRPTKLFSVVTVRPWNNAALISAIFEITRFWLLCRESLV